ARVRTGRSYRRSSATSAFGRDGNQTSMPGATSEADDRQGTKKGRRSGSIAALETQNTNSKFRIPNSKFFQPAAVVRVFAGKISLNAFMKRSISSAVPIDTRMCVVIGGKGRP